MATITHTVESRAYDHIFGACSRLQPRCAVVQQLYRRLPWAASLCVAVLTFASCADPTFAVSGPQDFYKGTRNQANAVCEPPAGYDRVYACATRSHVARLSVQEAGGGHGDMFRHGGGQHNIHYAGDGGAAHEANFSGDVAGQSMGGNLEMAVTGTHRYKYFKRPIVPFMQSVPPEVYVRLHRLLRVPRPWL